MFSVMENLRREYRDLETKILGGLREKVLSNNVDSEHIVGKAIGVSLFDYKEIVIVNDRLTFIDRKGYHHDLFSEADLEDLIDILIAHQKEVNKNHGL